MDANDSDALNNKGLAFVKLGRTDEAIQLFDKVLAMDANDSDALNNKGLAFVKLGRTDEAIQLFDKVLAMDANDSDALNNKGLAFVKLGRTDEAIQLFDKVLAMDTNNTDSLVNKGLALYNLGKTDEAVKYYDRALAIDPSDVEAQSNKDSALLLLSSLAQVERTIRISAQVTGEQTDRTDLSFTSNGYTSTYHLYAGGLDWSKSVGLLIYTDGSGEFGLKNPESSYLLAGSDGMIAVAKKHNMVLLTPLSPNKNCSDGDGSCWYLGDPSGYTKWAEELVTQVQSQYPIDKKRIAFGGYSSGAQFSTEYWVPSGAAQRTMEDGVIVAITYGGSPKVSEVSYTPAFKSNVHINWNTGDQDSSYNSRGEFGVKAGYEHYTSAGFQTSLDVLPGVGHSRSGEFGAVMDAQIAKHVPPPTSAATAALARSYAAAPALANQSLLSVLQ